MGFLRRLLGGRGSSLSSGAAAPPTGEEAVARWRYLVVTAPPEALASAHAEGLAALGADRRIEVLQRLRTALSALEPGAVLPADPTVLMRAAARAERRSPGFVERALSAGARGQPALTSLATAVVTTAAAAPFLRGFEPGLGGEALADRRAPDFDTEGGDPEVPAHHDGELDDED